VEHYRTIELPQCTHDVVHSTVWCFDTVNDESLTWLMFGKLAFKESW